MTFDLTLFLLEKIRLRAIHDFDPKQMNRKENRELRLISERIRKAEQIDPQQRYALHQNESPRHRCERYRIRKHIAIEYDREVSTCLKELHLLTQDKQIKPEKEFTPLEDNICSRREETSVNDDQEKAIKMVEPKSVEEQRELIADQNNLQNKIHLHDHYTDENTHTRATDSKWESDWESEFESESDRDWDWESATSRTSDSSMRRKVNLYDLVLPFKRGDIMEAILPLNSR